MPRFTCCIRELTLEKVSRENNGEVAAPPGHSTIMAEERKNGFQWLQALFMDNFGMSRLLAILSSVLVIFIFLFAVAWFFHSAPPRVITITTGPAGSSFETNAVRYRAILARSGVTLRILTSQGSQENLSRLEDPASPADIGFVQSGPLQRVPRPQDQHPFLPRQHLLPAVDDFLPWRSPRVALGVSEAASSSSARPAAAPARSP